MTLLTNVLHQSLNHIDCTVNRANLPHIYIPYLYHLSSWLTLDLAGMPQPELPEPAYPDLDSMLSRKFGREVANYFSGESD